MRDILHEQVSESTDAQFRARLAELVDRFDKRGYPRERLAEFHQIRSEQYCREQGITSAPWVTWSIGLEWKAKENV